MPQQSARPASVTQSPLFTASSCSGPCSRCATTHTRSACEAVEPLVSSTRSTGPTAEGPKDCSNALEDLLMWMGEFGGVSVQIF